MNCRGTVHIIRVIVNITCGYHVVITIIGILVVMLRNYCGGGSCRRVHVVGWTLVTTTNGRHQSTTTTATTTTSSSSSDSDFIQSMFVMLSHHTITRILKY